MKLSTYMPPRKKKKAVSVQASPGVKRYNYNINLDLLQVNWKTEREALKALILQKQKVFLPPPVLSHQGGDQFLRLVHQFRSEYRTDSGFKQFYQNLPNTINKLIILVVAAGLLSDAAFKRWSSLPRRNATCTTTNHTQVATGSHQ